MVLSKYNTANMSKLLDELDRFTIGLEPWFNSLNNSYAATSSSNYPPYDVVDLGEGKYRLKLALAGFPRDRIKVYVEKNLLTVEASNPTKDDEKYHYSGIAKRNFKRVWTLGGDIKLDDVKLLDGILTLNLSTVEPERPDRKYFEIS
jgi:HSP20 family molecular chaperone IbpA